MTHVLDTVVHGPAVQQVGDGAEFQPCVCVMMPVCPAGHATVREPGAGSGPQGGGGGVAQVSSTVVHGPAVQQVGWGAETQPWVWVMAPVCPAGHARVREPGAGAAPQVGGGSTPGFCAFQCLSRLRTAWVCAWEAAPPAWCATFSPWQPVQVRISPGCMVTHTRSRTIALPPVSVVCQLSARLAGTNAALDPSEAMPTLPSGPLLGGLNAMTSWPKGWAMGRRPRPMSW